MPPGSQKAGFSLAISEVLLLAVSLVVVLIAVLAGYLWPGTGTGVLKDLILFLGGSGVAIALAQASWRVSTTGRVRSLCRRSVQRLELTAQQALSAGEALRGFADAKRWDAGQAVAMMLDQLAEQAKVSIGDLEEMAGVQINLDSHLMDSVADVAHDAKRAARSMESSEARDPDVARRTLEQIGARLGRLDLVLDRPRPQLVALGTFQQIKRTISCPSCASRMRVSASADEGQVVLRNCFRCSHRLRIDLATGEINDDGAVQALDVTFVVENGKAVLDCPRCGMQIRTAARDDLMATCSRCTALLRGHRTPATTFADPAGA